MSDRLPFISLVDGTEVTQDSIPVTNELAGQLDLLDRLDVLAVGIVDKHKEIVVVMDGDLSFRAVDMPIWARNNNRGPGPEQPRYGFLLEDRDDSASDLYRVGDVFVPLELACVLSKITHPDIVAIRIRTGADTSAVVDARRGVYPKAIADPYLQSAAEIVDDVKREAPRISSLEATSKKLEELFDPDPFKCSFLFDGDRSLTATWEVDFSYAGLVLPSPSLAPVPDLSGRGDFINSLGLRLFYSKLDTVDERDISGAHRVFVQAQVQRVVGRVERSQVKNICRFGRSVDGKLEIKLDFVLDGHIPGPGPKGGLPTMVPKPLAIAA